MKTKGKKPRADIILAFFFQKLEHYIQIFGTVSEKHVSTYYAKGSQGSWEVKVELSAYLLPRIPITQVRDQKCLCEISYFSLQMRTNWKVILCFRVVRMCGQ